MKHQIYPCLWFNGNGGEAAELYTSLFKDSEIVTNTPTVVIFKIGDQQFMALNGGPQFKINPSISFYLTCESNEETDKVWTTLLEGGSVMMPLDKYPWSEKYGWLQDRFGMSWQISTGKLSDVGQKIVPSFLFVKDHYKQAAPAIKFYTSLFKDSSVTGILNYGPGEGDQEDAVKHAQFSVNKYVLMAMDSGADHKFEFNEAVSFVIPCEDQKEIDYFWDKLKEGGKESMCGWVQDQFGIWWQVIPDNLGQLMSSTKTGGAVGQALMKMKKLDKKALEEAAS